MQKAKKEWRNAEREEGGRDKPSKREERHNAGRAERPGQKSFGLFQGLTIQLSHNDTRGALFFRALRTKRLSLSLSSAAMSKGSSSSHARRQGAARWKQGWNDAWTGWDDSSATTSAIAESIPDERLTNAKTRDARSITVDWSSLRGVGRKRTPSKPHQGRRALPPMRPWSEPPRRASGRRRQSD